MADNFLFLIAAMDRLWFHQTILFLPEPFSPYSLKTLKPKQPHLESAIKIPSSSSSLSLSSLAEDTSTAVCPLHDQADDSKTEEKEVKKRPTRVSHSSSRSRSHSSSSPSSTEKREKNHRRSTPSCSIVGSKVKPQKSMSYRSLKDLELEEVKGFMDLGFIFKKEHLNGRMISVVPGLLRLGYLKKTKQKIELNLAPTDKHELSNKDDDDDDDDDDDNDIEQEDERCVIRPYLSEAWLIKRPDSPLLNLRVPKVSAAADMKKHLKFWARTVASVIQLES